MPEKAFIRKTIEELLLAESACKIQTFSFVFTEHEVNIQLQMYIGKTDINTEND